MNTGYHLIYILGMMKTWYQLNYNLGGLENNMSMIIYISINLDLLDKL